MTEKVCGDHVLSFLFSAKPAIQNPNIHQGMFLANNQFIFLFTAMNF